MKRTHKRYNRIFLAGALLLVAGTVLFNGLIDPFSIYPGQSLAALSKYRKIGPSRITIAESMVRLDPEVILLGTSRTKNGLRVDHPAFAGRRCFNAGLPAGSMEELRHVARVAADKTAVQEVVFFADFFSFNDNRTPIAGFSSSRFSPTWNAVEFHLEQLLSLTAVTRSKQVLWRWRSDTTGKKKKVINRKVIAKELAAFHNDPMLYGNYTSSEVSWGHLVAMRNLLRDKKISLKVVLLPVHATMLETLRHAGLWKEWENWKRRLLTVLGPAVPVWDFQYYGHYTARPAGESGDIVAAMQWFKDPSHPLPQLCDLALNRVYGRAGDAGPEADFGRRLEGPMMEEWIAGIREQRRRYAARYPQDIHWIESILKKQD